MAAETSPSRVTHETKIKKKKRVADFACVKLFEKFIQDQKKRKTPM